MSRAWENKDCRADRTRRAWTFVAFLVLIGLVGLLGTLDYETQVGVAEEEKLHAGGVR